MSRLTVPFLLLASAFMLTHYIALAGSLYWYYWWFDIMMHFWGGILLGLGTHVLCRFRVVPLRPTLLVLLSVVTVAVVSWEVFEWWAGLYNPAQYVFDTAQDIVIGFGGGLLAHIILRHLYNRAI